MVRENYAGADLVGVLGSKEALGRLETEESVETLVIDAGPIVPDSY
jgi:hypothetical protein